MIYLLLSIFIGLCGFLEFRRTIFLAAIVAIILGCGIAIIDGAIFVSEWLYPYIKVCWPYFSPLLSFFGMALLLIQFSNKDDRKKSEEKYYNTQK